MTDQQAAEHSLTITSHSPQQTQAIGEAIGRALAGGVMVAVVGHLGAGKTQLIKGVAIGNGLDSADKVTSPTFTLVQEYPGRLWLYHIDVYRLKSPADLTNLGFDEMLQRSDAAVCVEWADRVERLLLADRLAVKLRSTGDSSRELVITASGALSQKTLNLLRATERFRGGRI